MVKKAFSHLKTHRHLWEQVASPENLLSAAREAMLGNLTRQFFANIYLDGFDHFVKQTLRVSDYVRYLDGTKLPQQCRLGDQPRIRSRGEKSPRVE